MSALGLVAPEALVQLSWHSCHCSAATQYASDICLAVAFTCLLSLSDKRSDTLLLIHSSLAPGETPYASHRSLAILLPLLPTSAIASKKSTALAREPREPKFCLLSQRESHRPPLLSSLALPSHSCPALSLSPPQLQLLHSLVYLMDSTQLHCRVTARLQILGSFMGPCVEHGDVAHYHADLTSCNPAISNSTTSILLLADSYLDIVTVGSWVDVVGDLGPGSHGAMLSLVVGEMVPSHSAIPYHEAMIVGRVRSKHNGHLPGLSIDCLGLGWSAHASLQV